MPTEKRIFRDSTVVARRKNEDGVVLVSSFLRKSRSDANSRRARRGGVLRRKNGGKIGLIRERPLDREEEKSGEGKKRRSLSRSHRRRRHDVFLSPTRTKISAHAIDKTTRQLRAEGGHSAVGGRTGASIRLYGRRTA